MTVRELGAALELSKRIKQLEYSLEDIRATGGLKSATVDVRVMGGVKVDVCDIVVMLSVEIAELRLKLHDCKVIIAHEIAKINFTDTERKIIKLRYHDLWAWRYIQKAIGYSRSKTFLKHSEAIRKLEDIS